VSLSSTKVNNSKSNLSLSGLGSTSDFNLNANNVAETRTIAKYFIISFHKVKNSIHPNF
jgi:hypothetical protein